EVFAALAGLTTDSVADIEQTSAASAFLYATLPGVAVAGEPTENVFESAPYIHHFPDGMASLARLIVRRLIPSVAPGNSMEDVVTAPFDYARLDLAENAVRVRLNSTVIHVERHAGATRGGEEVSITYVCGGAAQRVRANRCILACNNRIIPALCPQLPAPQREALRGRVRAPLVYTNVALTNWRAFKELGVGAIAMPGGYHVNAMLDFPVSLGDYRFPESPDEPVLLHMERFFTYPEARLPPPQRFAVARNELLTTPFTTIERNVRAQLTSMLGPGGFDPARDIAGITVNRWSHGYAYSYDWMNDEYYDDWDDERYAHVVGRKPFGPIAIANSDADAIALFPNAAMQAYRAVEEIS
ncbi:MAG: spermidine dehydrogenase, partial [Pseudomonadales bacterium]|nr:spermidine dehydrogenase [Pseudomonadales bacterium]